VGNVEQKQPAFVSGSVAGSTPWNRVIGLAKAKQRVAQEWHRSNKRLIGGQSGDSTRKAGAAMVIDA
jgi:hypothetical protein